MNISFLLEAQTGLPMCRSPLENIAYGFVLTYPAVPSRVYIFKRIVYSEFFFSMYVIVDCIR